MKPIILRQHEVVHLRDHGSVIAWRVVKPQRHPFGHMLSVDEVAKEVTGETCAARCPCGRTGEERWVKETFRFDGIDHSIALSQQDMSEGVYRADLIGDRMVDDCPWISSTHMPRWASRFTVTLDVGLKRIQEVTEEEAIGSGAKRGIYFSKDRAFCEPSDEIDERISSFKNGLAFEIESHGEGSWDRNDYFWKITCTLKK